MKLVKILLTKRGFLGPQKNPVELTSILRRFTLINCQLSVPKAIANSATDTTAHIVAKDNVIAEQGIVKQLHKLEKSQHTKCTLPPHTDSHRELNSRYFVRTCHTCPLEGRAMKGAGHGGASDRFPCYSTITTLSNKVIVHHSIYN